MNGGYLQAMMFLLNRPEPIRQSSLLMVLASGLGDAPTLIAGLKSLAAESGPPWSDRIHHLWVLLEQGQTLSDALSSVPGLLPEQSLIAIRVAEQCGTLKQVLADEAYRLMNQSAAGNPVSPSGLAAMAWLLTISCVTLSSVTFLMIFIVPKFKKIFDDFGVGLPGPTHQLINAADWLSEYWYLTIFPLASLIVYMLYQLVARQIERLSTGHVWLSEYLPRFWTPVTLRLLAVAVTAERSFADAIHSILRELRPGRAAQHLSAVRQEINGGRDCWTSLRQHGFLTSREVSFLNSATKTRHLDWGLMHLSRAIERRRARWMQRMVNLVAPLLLLLIGSTVALICVALFLPLIDLVDRLSLPE